MREFEHIPTIKDCGWTLVSAEARSAKNPKTFQIPSFEERSSLSRGMAAKLLFDIATTEDGKLRDRGVDRMWVIVTSVLDVGYQGVLDSDPGTADGLALAKGDLVFFRAEHISGVDRPPREFLVTQLSEFFTDN
ncbi:MAG: hypothetical protein AAGL99_13365 [Pseudomonadota bacterium]